MALIVPWAKGFGKNGDDFRDAAAGIYIVTDTTELIAALQASGPRTIIISAAGGYNLNGTQVNVSDCRFRLCGQACPGRAYIYNGAIRLTGPGQPTLQHLWIGGGPDRSGSVFISSSNHTDGGYVEHCVFVYGNQENVGLRDVTGWTFAYCIFGQSFFYPAGAGSGQRKALLLEDEGGTNMLLYRCLFLHANARTPAISQNWTADMVQCIGYNDGQVNMGLGKITGAFNVNLLNNIWVRPGSGTYGTINNTPSGWSVALINSYRQDDYNASPSFTLMGAGFINNTSNVSTSTPAHTPPDDVDYDATPEDVIAAVLTYAGPWNVGDAQDAGTNVFDAEREALTAQWCQDVRDGTGTLADVGDDLDDLVAAGTLGANTNGYPISSGSGSAVDFTNTASGDMVGSASARNTVPDPENDPRSNLDILLDSYATPPYFSGSTTPPPDPGTEAFADVESITATAFASAATAHAANYPASVDADDLLLILGGFVAATTPTITTPSGYTLIATTTRNSGDNILAAGIYAKIAAGTEGGGTIDVPTAVNAKGTVQVWRVSNWSGDLDDIEISAALSAAGGTQQSSGALSPTAGQRKWLWISLGVTSDDDVAVTANPTNYTAGDNTACGGGADDSARCLSAYRKIQAATETPGVFTIGSSESWLLWTLAIAPSTGSVGSAPSVVTNSAFTTTAVSSPESNAFDCTGADLLVVWVAYEQGTANDISGITYNGVALTKAVDQLTGSSESFAEDAELWYLVSPASGSNTLAVSFDEDGSDAVIVAVALSTGNTSDPIGDTDSGTAENEHQSSTIVTERDNGLLLGFMGCRAASMTPFTPDGSETEVYDANVGSGNAGIAYWFGHLGATTAGSHDIGVTSDVPGAGSNWTEWIAVEIRAAAAGGDPEFDQTDYRLRNDDGNETAATWVAAANTAASLDVDTNYRARVVIGETADVAAANTSLKWQYSHNFGPWTDINGSSDVVRSAASANVADAADTTQQLGSGTFLSTNAGFDEADGAFGGANLDFAGSDEMEAEICFQIRSADTTDADNVRLRVVLSDDTALDTYTQIPSITVSNPPEGPSALTFSSSPATLSQEDPNGTVIATATITGGTAPFVVALDDDIGGLVSVVDADDEDQVFNLVLADASLVSPETLTEAVADVRVTDANELEIEASLAINFLAFSRTLVIRSWPMSGLNSYSSADVDETPQEVKGGKGTLFGYYIANNAAALRVVKIFDARSGDVVVGTTTPTLRLPLPAGQAANVWFGDRGVSFDDGITVAAVAGVADNDTTAPDTNDVIVNAFFD